MYQWIYIPTLSNYCKQREETDMDTSNGNECLLKSIWALP